MSINGHSEKQMAPKLLLQVSAQELHNKMVSTLEEGGLKEARDEENNIIIRNHTLCNILPTKLKNMYSRYKDMCDCECCIYTKMIYYSLISLRDCYLRNINSISQNAQNRRSGKMANRLFETYKNYVVPRGRHIYATAYYMTMDTVCSYTP